MLKRFLRDRRGNVTIIAAFTLPVLVLGIGGAADYAHVVRAKAKIQSAVDSALLATMAHRQTLNKPTARQLMSYFKSHLNASMGKLLDRQVEFTAYRMRVDDRGNTVRVQVQARIKTTFLKLAAINEFRMPLEAEARASMNHTEVALVLDVTGSMRGRKIRELKKAAKKFLSTIHEKLARQGKVDNFHVAIVPFTRYVNIGTQYRGASWLDVEPDRTLSKEKCWRRWCWTVTREVRWQGCVGSRAHPLNVKDENYSLHKVPGVMDHMRDKRFPADSYDGYTWYKNDCPPPLTPLKSLKRERALLERKIDELSPGGWTYIPAGLTWGWRVLSSKAPFSEGANDDRVVKDNVRKVIVLMTDGANSRAPSQRSKIYPYSEHASSSRSYADDLTREACANIAKVNPRTGRRNADIITITFDIRNANTKKLMKDCSTLGSYDAGSGQLVAQFEDIANKLVELHLSR